MNSLPRKQLQSLMELLVFAVASDTLPSDCALVVATSLCLVYSFLMENDKSEHFFHFLKVIESFEELKDKEAVKTSIEQLHTFQCDKNTYTSYDDLKISYPLVLAVNGLLNSGISWIYHPGCRDEKGVSASMDVSDSSYKRDSAENENSLTPGDVSSESAKALEVCDAPTTENCTKKVLETSHGQIFLYELYTFFSKSCGDSSSYSFLVFQVRN